MPLKKSHDVFGISNTVLPDSYIDRGRLDEELALYLDRPNHIALRGESKCGKSWLRQRIIPRTLVVQCRLGKSVVDIYTDALSQLGILLELKRSSGGSFRGQVSAQGQIGIKLLAQVNSAGEIEGSRDWTTESQQVGRDIQDLRFIADLIKVSGYRLIIEDFHYMSTRERKEFAFDLKALWEYGLFVVIIGVWSRSNLLQFLNPDLSGRVHEIGIYWSDEDLKSVLDKGGNALNLEFSDAFKDQVSKDCFGSVGILQKLTLNTLDELKTFTFQNPKKEIDDLNVLETASMLYAEQINPLYQQFASRVSNGIRTRNNSTGIYAHAMAIILDSPDEELIQGIHLDQIFRRANARESRIQKGNLRVILEKFEGLQVDEDGRGLVLGYNEATSEIAVVDRQLLLYRKYLTISWPWENLINEMGFGEDKDFI